LVISVKPLRGSKETTHTERYSTMTDLEELRQYERELLEVIWQLRQATSPAKVERTQRMIEVRKQLRAVRTELALVEQTKVS
tara:strand:+ start:198 stop:443 length:246 start_codon:yes stop_codon:yes gene_type:complete